jgi:hypothetical protein
VAEQGGENSLCGGNPPQPKSVAEIRHGGKNRLGGILPWRKNIAVAENRRGGKKSPWRKKIAMAEKIAVAEFRHGGKISPWRKIAMAEKFFYIRPSSVSTLFILFEKRIRYGSEMTRTMPWKLKLVKFRKKYR